MKPLILGSVSPWRRQVLASAGIPFTPMSADIDEKSIRRADPRQLTLALAMAKAAALLDRIAEPSLLITSDQVAVWRGNVLEKPADADEARRFLRGYRSDEPVRSVTAVLVCDTESRRSRHVVDVADVWFDEIPWRAIEGAISRGTVLKSCGAFAIDDPDLAPFVLRMEGDGDEAEVRTSIDGLPLAKTLALLETFGWFPPDHDWSETT